jgi:hypothetical protein
LLATFHAPFHSKCGNVLELEYLGHKILAAGVLSLPSHVAAIQEFLRLSLTKVLKAFLRMINFYWRFLPSITRMPLYQPTLTATCPC